MERIPLICSVTNVVILCKLPTIDLYCCALQNCVVVQRAKILCSSTMTLSVFCSPWGSLILVKEIYFALGILCLVIGLLFLGILLQRLCYGMVTHLSV